MKQHIAQDPTSVEYASALESMWASWEPWLLHAEMLLREDLSQYDPDDLAEAFRQTQYHAHLTSELSVGMYPPALTQDSHEYLVAVMTACRDTLGSLAVRAELREVDETTLEIGLHSVATTREAFQTARHSSMALYAFAESMHPMFSASAGSAGGAGKLVWSMVAACTALFGVLLFELFLLMPSS